MMETHNSTSAAPEATTPVEYFRLAFIGPAENPNACGPRFPTLKAAQEAAPTINASRIARGLEPCSHVLEFGRRLDRRNWQARCGTVALFLLDGTMVRTRR
jgi:hypothetical protein